MEGSNVPPLLPIRCSATRADTVNHCLYVRLLRFRSVDVHRGDDVQRIVREDLDCVFVSILVFDVYINDVVLTGGTKALAGFGNL